MYVISYVDCVDARHNHILVMTRDEDMARGIHYRLNSTVVCDVKYGPHYYELEQRD